MLTTRSTNHGNRLDFYPAEHRKEIDELNALIYPKEQRRVPRRLRDTQEATRRPPLRYSPRSTSSTRGSHAALSHGPRVTEADWRFFTTLARFDAVYFGHFKCNRRRIVDYPSLWGYVRDLYQTPGVAETVNIEYYKRHY